MKLILLAGQSNMTGRGVVTPEDRLEIPGLMYMAKDRFEIVIFVLLFELALIVF